MGPHGQRWVEMGEYAEFWSPMTPLEFRCFMQIYGYFPLINLLSGSLSVYKDRCIYIHIVIYSYVQPPVPVPMYVYNQQRTTLKEIQKYSPLLILLRTLF
jgi:hypothetical protein